MSKHEFTEANKRMDAIQVGTNVRHYVKSLMRPPQAKMILEVLAESYETSRLTIDEALVTERMGKEMGEQFIANALEHRDDLIAIARIVLGKDEAE